MQLKSLSARGRSPAVLRLAPAAFAVFIGAGFGAAALADAISAPNLPADLVPDALSGLPASSLPDASAVSYAEATWILDWLTRYGPVLLLILIASSLLFVAMRLARGWLHVVSRRRRRVSDMIVSSDRPRQTVFGMDI
jgi:hypothetical protein